VIGGATVNGGVATFSTSFTAVGTHSISALYGADAVNSSSTSATVNLSLNTGVKQVYYIHSDHLNTPRNITDTSGAVVWLWDNSDPFGNNAANENPSGAGQFSFPLRFAGQYFDKETNTRNSMVSAQYGVTRSMVSGLVFCLLPESMILRFYVQTTEN